MVEHYLGKVQPAWVDHNRHMNLAYYVLAFDLATDVFFQSFGVDQNYRNSTNFSTFAGNIHVYYKSELQLDEEFKVSCSLLGFDNKRIRHMNQMFRTKDGVEVAVLESLQLHVDLNDRRVCNMPGSLVARLEMLQSEQGFFEIPKEIGQAITKPPVYNAS